jgi:lipopolysaccharide export system permease protein
MISVVKRVDRLIASGVLAATVVVWTLLVTVDAFSGLVRELDEIGQGSYALGDAIAYIAWTVPRRAYDLFGIAAVIGSVLGLGALAATAELTAMRAAGMSKRRIALSALTAIGVGLLVVAALGETLGPYGDRRALALAAGAKSEDLIAAGGTGLWAREGASLLNARRGEVREGVVTLYDVRLYDFTADGQLERITTAERARHARGRWRLDAVTRRQFTAERIATTSLPGEDWRSTLDPELLTASIVRPRHLGIGDLLAGMAYLRRNGLDASAFESALWSRVFYPINVLAVVIATLPFAFGALRSGGFGKRILLGIVLATGWYFFQRAVVNVASVYALDFRLVHLLPAMALVAAAAVYFRRAA